MRANGGCIPSTFRTLTAGPAGLNASQYQLPSRLLPRHWRTITYTKCPVHKTRECPRSSRAELAHLALSPVPSPANLRVSRRPRLHRSATALTYDEVDLTAPLLLQVIEREVRQSERRVAVAGVAYRCLAGLTTRAHAPVRHPIVPRARSRLLRFPPVARRLPRRVLLVVRVWVHVGDVQKPALQLPLRVCVV